MQDGNLKNYIEKFWIWKYLDPTRYNPVVGFYETSRYKFIFGKLRDNWKCQ
jgi:hypothetical protein